MHTHIYTYIEHTHTHMHAHKHTDTPIQMLTPTWALKLSSHKSLSEIEDLFGLSVGGECGSALYPPLAHSLSGVCIM